MKRDNLSKQFYKQLFGKASMTISVVIISLLLNIWVIPKLNITGAEWIILLLTFLKIYLIVRLSFNQLIKIIGQSHLLSHILVLFGLLMSLIVLSFATDFAALHLIESAHFKADHSIADTPLKILFEYSYLSLITFSSVGFGDIVPLSIMAKLMVMLEVILRFFVLVFGIANINQIKVNTYNKDQND